MRVHFFNVIAHHNSEDVKQRYVWVKISSVANQLLLHLRGKVFSQDLRKENLFVCFQTQS